MAGGVPRWLESMLGDRFFGPCRTHEELKKNERNVYCVDCCVGLCPSCLRPHRAHHLIQIRRYVYHDVVRFDDFDRLFDCSSVQTYTANSAKVVFLNERAQGRPSRGDTSCACAHCDRAVHSPNLFCCLSCKVKYLQATDGGLWNNLRECQSLPSHHVGHLSLEATASSDSGCTADTAGTGLVTKKRTGSGERPAAPPCAEAARRRKGVPCRAPLF